ncbi:MAG: hypothetical protein Q7U39_07905 [Nitrospira sp.]|nr:hypothetical protein [Nitrospira sp.]
MVTYSEAAEWSVVPSLGVKGVYNDNLLLTPLPHDATYGYWTSPAAEFAGKTERLEVSGKVAADFVTYYGGEETTFTNIFLPLSMRYKTEKDLLGFTGGFSRDNTLMSELLATGVVVRFTQRNQWNASPTWAHSLTEKLSLQSSFQFTDTTYENGLRLGLVNYQLLGGSGGLLYQLTEQDQIQLTGIYTSFHTTNASSGFRATFPGAMMTITHAFTESLTGTAFGGPRFISTTTQATGGDVKAQETVWVYGASLAKQFESGSIQLSAARDIIPSGFGLLIQTDRVTLSGSYKVSETLLASLDANGYLVTGATQRLSGGSFPEQRYASLSPKLAWKFLEWWRLEASYTYGWRDVENFLTPATSNAAMLMLTYYPPKLALSN